MGTTVSPTPGRTIRLVWAAAALAVLTVAAIATVVLAASRTAALRQADDLLRQVVATAETDVNRGLMGVDLALAGLPDVLAPALGPHGLDPSRAHTLLSQMLDRHLMLADVAVVDLRGGALATGLPATLRTGPTLPPGLLDRLAAQPAPVLLVSDPVVGRASGERTLVLARRLSLPGRPDLAAVAEVPITLLVQLTPVGGTQRGLRLSLERDDGRVLATQPVDDTLTGRRVTPLRLAQATGDVRAGPGRIDGRPTREAARPTLYQGLWLTASQPEDGALAAWSTLRTQVVGVAAVFVALLLATAFAAQAQVRRLAQARRAAAEAAALLDQALTSMGDAFLLCDPEDRVLRWNPQYADMFPWLRPVLRVGVPFQELARAAASQRRGPGGDEARRAWFDERLASRLRGDHEFMQTLHDGRVVGVVERRLPSGGIVSVYRDMSAAERRLAEAKAEADAANEAKSRFLTTMSHEMRTPLNAVLGLNDLLLASPLSDAQRHHAELVRASGQLLLALINDLLDLSRIEAGRFEASETVFRPRRVAEEVMAMLQERARDAGLALQLHDDGGADAPLRGDALRLRQVLFNLLGNALKFTERGGVTVRLWVEGDDGADAPVTLHLAVRDTGVGIAPEAQGRLFERFTQADDSTRRRYGGSGLGLAITREVLDRLGGRITLHSVPGQGSVFSVQLPCHRAPAPAEPAAAVPAPPAGAAEPAAADTGVSRPLDVVVAEDNEVNQVLIQALLERLGHRVRIAPNGQAAVAMVAGGPPDLVLMDMQMPGQDGLDATREIRRLPGAAGGVPIVAITANARDDDRRACLAAGMNDFVSKPIDFGELAGAIDRAVTAA